jgi:hypothetical protein
MTRAEVEEFRVESSERNLERVSPLDSENWSGFSGRLTSLSYVQNILVKDKIAVELPSSIDSS